VESHPAQTPTSVGDALAACKQSFIGVGVFSGVANLLMLVPAFYMLNIYDKAVGNNSVSTLVVLSVLTAVMFVGLFSMEVVRGWLLVTISSRLDKLLAPILYEKSFINAINVGKTDASAMPLQDLASLRQFLTGTPIFALFDAPWLPIYIVILFLFHPLLGWLGVSSAALLFSIAVLNQRQSQSAIADANALANKNHVDTAKNLRNAEVAAAMGMTTKLLSRWRKRQDATLHLQGTASKTAVFYNSITKVLRMAVQSAAIGLGGYLVLLQEISPGMIIAGSILIGRALQPVELAVGAWKGFVDAKEQYSRLDEVIEKIPLPRQGMPLPPVEGHVSIVDAVVKPPASAKPTIQCKQLSIAAGEVALILGPSGAGKSSLVRGILGLWPAAVGAIRIDGAAAHDFNRDEIGPQIGYLPQDIELIDGTVGENIARFGEVDSGAVVAAACDAGIHDFILSLPFGYDTQIGSEGGLLSPGQRQRIALARAIYNYPKLLVLDEPNSNLDEAGETALNDTIKMMRDRGSTVLIVSHRQSVLPLADVLILVSSGHVEDFGKSDEVLARVQAKQSTSAAQLAPPRVKSEDAREPDQKFVQGDTSNTSSEKPKAAPKSPVTWAGSAKAGKNES